MVRLLGLFEAIAASPDGLSLAELSLRLGSPKSSLLMLLRPLAAGGYLHHRDGRYRLGAVIFEFAQRILGSRQTSVLVRAAMEELWERSGETVILTAIDRAAEVVTYVECLDSPQMVRYVVPAGTVRPLYCSAAGQLLLAFQDRPYQDSYLAKARLEAMTPDTITDAGQLRLRLDDILVAGMSRSHHEAILGAAGIAVPIRLAGNEVRQALLVAGPADRLKHAQKKLQLILRDVSRRLSSSLGYQPGA